MPSPPAAKSRKSDKTRERIVEAAQKIFSEQGYERTTIRAVAQAAEINPSMVIRYFSSKEELFARAVTFDLRLPGAGNIPVEQVGRRMAAHFIGRWEEQNGGELAALLRASVSHEAARAKMHEIFHLQLVAFVERIADPGTAPARAALIASQMLGLALSRYVLQLPALVALPAETIIREVGDTIQTYLTRPMPATGEP